MYAKILKRMLDVILSFMAILLLALPMLLIALVIRIDSKGPALFRQKRVGKGKKLFTILKFRTMQHDAPHETPTPQMQEASRWTTRVGGFLRRTSLDELPQLFNILVGQMSFVGPRPALWNEFELIEARDANGANALRPGLTGWAQINGRNRLDPVKKVEYDGENSVFSLISSVFSVPFRCFMNPKMRNKRKRNE